MSFDPRTAYPRPPFATPKISMPGGTKELDPRPDHGEESYKGSGRLAGKSALITGADSGIGRAVAIAFAREGADVLISYLEEHDDAKETASWVTKAGRRAVAVAGDVSQERHCEDLVARTIQEFGKIDVLVNNAAFQASHEIHRGNLRRRVGQDVPRQHLRVFLPGQGRDAPHEAGRQHHRDVVGQRQDAVAAIARLRDHEGRDRELHRGARAIRRREGHPGRTASAPARSGRRSSRRPCRTRKSRSSARRCRWAVPRSRSSSPPPTSCWPPTNPVSYRVRIFR